MQQIIKRFDLKYQIGEQVVSIPLEAPSIEHAIRAVEAQIGHYYPGRPFKRIAEGEENFIIPQLGTDSADYSQVRDAVFAVKDVPGLSLEIGVRAGGGSEVIMKALSASGQKNRTHVGIDPYGNIEYEQSNGQMQRNDYTNEMRNVAIHNLYAIAHNEGVNFLFYQLEDTEFFNRFADGVPVYQQNKELINRYAYVLFDGPHGSDAVFNETVFFEDRASVGAIFTYDDVVGFYNHDQIDSYLLNRGWKVFQMTDIKASYIKNEMRY